MADSPPHRMKRGEGARPWFRERGYSLPLALEANRRFPLVIEPRQPLSYGKRGYQIGIASVDLLTGDATLVVADGGSAFLAPNGQLVFSRRNAILAAPFDLAKSTLTSSPVAILDGLRTLNSWTQGSFVLSKEGSLAYTPGGQIGSKRKLALALSGGLVEPWSDEEREFDTTPSVTRDGQRAAVVIPSPEATWEIWIAEKGRAGLRRFMGTPGVDIAGPVWSPDATMFAFNYRRRISELFLVEGLE